MWTYEQFLNYLMAVEKIENREWMREYLIPEMKKKMLHIVRSVYHELLPHPGVFELFGVDFLLDENLKVWFIEVVKSPAMQATTKEKGRILRKMINEVLDVEYAIIMGKELEDEVGKTGFEFVYNGRKECPECFAGLLETDCVGL
jgi:hypothetical protein